MGIVLMMAILFWIPTHMLTYSMRYHEDYRLAGIPTVPARYGFHRTRQVIAVSSIMAALAIAVATIGLGLSNGLLGLIGLLSAGLLILAVVSMLQPSYKINFSLFKYASV